jgi:hypothetical protein
MSRRPARRQQFFLDFFGKFSGADKPRSVDG